ncbi:hypothetical protein A148_13945 [Vibrio splendidus 1F-157]|nr:hypothetical protein A148_13945 [Vibrio splendidus 1F-157]
MQTIIGCVAIGLQMTTAIPQEGNRACPHTTVLIVVQYYIFHIEECGFWRVFARAVEPHVIPIRKIN